MLLGSLLVSLQDPLLLRWHARWTAHVAAQQLRNLRLVSSRKVR